MKVIGIDPGLGGALALLDGQGQLLGVADMPAADGRVMAGELADLLSDWRSNGIRCGMPESEPLPPPPRVHVRIELAQAMPANLRGRRQGNASAFKFGRAFGCVEGVVEALTLPSSTVTSGQWKRRMGVTSDKETSRALAQRLWPEHRDAFKRKMDADRAEAALIALDYLRNVLRVPA